MILDYVRRQKRGEGRQGDEERRRGSSTCGSSIRGELNGNDVLRGGRTCEGDGGPLTDVGRAYS